MLKVSIALQVWWAVCTKNNGVRGKFLMLYKHNFKHNLSVRRVFWWCIVKETMIEVSSCMRARNFWCARGKFGMTSSINLTKSLIFLPSGWDELALSILGHKELV